jgi:hypothetical protein
LVYPKVLEAIEPWHVQAVESFSRLTASQRGAPNGKRARDHYKATSLENAAADGRAAALQIGAAYTQIATALANIDAVQAANNTNPTSPTGLRCGIGTNRSA